MNTDKSLYTKRGELEELCKRKDYFTLGSEEQFNLMLSIIGEEEFYTRDIAMFIWVCSNNIEFTNILSDVQKILGF